MKKKKMPKKLFMFLAILAAGFLVEALVSDEIRARKRVKEITQINIPLDATMVANYYIRNNSFIPVPGRRSQYIVFRFNETPDIFLDNNGFILQKDKSFESGFNRTFVFYKRHFEDELSLEYCPNWDDEYLYLHISRGSVYFTYFVESGLLMIMIIGH